MINRWITLAKKIVASNFASLSHTYKLTYVVTKECHSRCLNCAIWKVKPKNELRLDEIRLLAKNFPHWSWIDFTGGEPTDRSDFVDVVASFLEYCPNLLLVHFPTNGLKPKRVERICENILQQKKTCKLVVSVSIDGPPELNDTLRGIPNDFERAIETYQRLSKIRGLSVYVGMTLYQESMKRVDETVRAIRSRIPEFNYSKLHINLPYTSEHYYENHNNAPQASREMIEVVDGYMQKRGMALSPFARLERMYHQRISSYIERGICPQDCASLLSSCFLAEDGTVYPCSIWNEPLGNVRDTEYQLEALLRSEKAVDLRERLLRKECSNCWTPCEAYQTIFANLRNFKN